MARRSLLWLRGARDSRAGNPLADFTKTRAAPALLVFLATVLLVSPSVRLWQHPDEAQYGWSAGYFGSLVAEGDFRRSGNDLFTDPGWSPYSYWSTTTAMGSRYLYAITLGVTPAETPQTPYSYTEPRLQGPETLLDETTLVYLRWTAVLAAAIGLGLIAWRFRWSGAAAMLIVLAIPHVRADLGRAWAEGPLVLGFGLVAAAYGTRFFAPACGIAATFKLTALGLWPLAALKRANGGLTFARGLLLTFSTFILLTPPAWIAPPVQFGRMIEARLNEYEGQSVGEHAFLPSRYFLPLELAAAILGTEALRRVLKLAASHWREPRHSDPVASSSSTA